jgi:hypothetical protein
MGNVHRRRLLQPGEVRFRWVRRDNVYRPRVVFSAATLADHAFFDEATFTGGASFNKATFGRWCKLGPLRAALVSLSSAVFNESAEIHLRAATVRDW